MSDKRFSIFISSTFEDLREERQAVQDAVLSAGDFPVQMEYFPATDQDQFEFIKTLIDKCDYYVLIVAGRYGTVTSDGTSYTEKEYRYAKSRNIPVLAMIHGDPSSIPVGKTEKTNTGRKQLARFVEEVSTGRVRNTWVTTGDLKHAVRDALDAAKATRPGIGWLRGDTTASAALLKEMNEVRKENEKYRDTIGQLKVELPLPPIPDSDNFLEIDLTPRTRYNNPNPETIGTYAKIRCTWIGAFPVFFTGLIWKADDWNGDSHYWIDRDMSQRTIGQAFAAEFATFDTEGLFLLSKNSFERLHSYYLETGLMVENGAQPFTQTGRSVARRHRIANVQGEEFKIVEGKVDYTKGIPLRDLPDEIPF